MTLTYRIFVGCPMTAELRLQLHQSPSWKQAKIASSSQDLTETPYNEKDYIGLYLAKDLANFQELKESKIKIFQALKTYCPEFASEKIKIVVFSQVFIS